MIVHRAGSSERWKARNNKNCQTPRVARREGGEPAALPYSAERLVFFFWRTPLGRLLAPSTKHDRGGGFGRAAVAGRSDGKDAVLAAVLAPLSTRRYLVESLLQKVLQAMSAAFLERGRRVVPLVAAADGLDDMLRRARGRAWRELVGRQRAQIADHGPLLGRSERRESIGELDGEETG